MQTVKKGMVISMRYGLIGEKLGHSYSKIIHAKLADYMYDLIPLTREEFKSFMEARDFAAINVTIPYKQDVIPYLDEIDERALKIGAVNTIVNKDGKLKGYNTDIYGFIYMLKQHDIQVTGKKCLILGDGGTSHTVQAALSFLNASEIYVVSRKASLNELKQNPASLVNTISYDDCYQFHTDADVIVNTTSAGMYPNIDLSPLDLTTFTSCKAVADVIYNPIKTKLTLQAEQLGMKAVNGLEMLVAQAVQAAEYFLDTKYDEKIIDEIYKEILETL